MTRALRVLLARISLGALLLGGPALAAPLPAADAPLPGAHDHPLLSRYAGSRLVAYLAKGYDETDLAAGPYESGGAGLQFARLVHAEGRLTRIAYNYAADRSALEVMRNYRNALQAAGLKTVFSCDKDSCGDRSGEPFAREMLFKKLDAASIAFGDDNDTRDPFGASEAHYLLASSTRADGKSTYASVYVVPPVSGNNGGVLLEIVEPEAMEAGKVAVDLDASQMGKGLAADGKVALYGLYFDSGKSELRADSKPTLAEMAKLLRQDPALRAYIVGHTDNQGTYVHNLELSQKRAESVVAALVAGYTIDPKRLVPKGVASVAPVASNDTEAGRTRNRRVELVKQ